MHEILSPPSPEHEILSSPSPERESYRYQSVSKLSIPKKCVKEELYFYQNSLI